MGLSIIAIIVLALFIAGKHEFQLKSFFRSFKCHKNGHKNVTVYGYTQQCKRCYKVSEISKEVAKR